MKPGAGNRCNHPANTVSLPLIIALFSVPGVASALKNLFGYIPGVGTVDQSIPLRVLAEPVTAARDGYTLTIESALLDSTHTLLNYRITGQFPTWSDPALEPATCQEFSVLRLPDGSELAYPAREYSTSEGEIRMKEVFAAVPAGQNSAVLVLPCLPGLPAGVGLQNWEVPLAFAPAPPELTVFPVVEQPTAEPQKPPEASAENDIRLSLQGVAELDGGYFLQTVLSWQADPNLIDVQVFPDAIRLTDAAGQDVAVWPAEQILPPAPGQRQTMPLDLTTAPIAASGEATLVVDYIAITRPADTHFTIDLGEDPQPGQVWQVNQDEEGEGRIVKDTTSTPTIHPMIRSLPSAQGGYYYSLKSVLIRVNPCFTPWLGAAHESRTISVVSRRICFFSGGRR